jgi:hypothetical protein
MEDAVTGEADEEQDVDGEGEGTRKPQRLGVKMESKGIKTEHGRGGKGKGVKLEYGKGKGKWLKTEDLSDEEKLSRRIAWLNQNIDFDTPIQESEALPALDCVGLRLAMRTLRRLEESAAEVTDPNDFIKDEVARSGWIWSKPDIIDDDEKVAKRVSWLNQFGALASPIDYADVADMLDGLKVPHAMVLLRELEMQSGDVEDPTAYVKQQIASAGGDDVPLPEVDAASEDSAIGQRIAALNASGMWAAPIEFSEVLSGLTRIGDSQAMSLLQEIENKGPSLKDPRDTETEILKRVEWLNDYGGIATDIDYNKVSAPLEALGIDHAMTILKELEDKRASIRDPTAFIRQAASLSKGAPPAAAGAQARVSRVAGEKALRKASGPAQSKTDVQTLSGFIGLLNEKSNKAFKFSDVASALDTLGSRATAVLKEMQEKGLGLDDPASYINAAAFRVSKDKAAMKRGGDEDDVQKLSRKMNWLNQFGGLAETIKMEEVVGALYCLGVPQSMAILKGLQEKGARVKDPTSYIKSAVQRTNGLIASKAEPELDEDEEEAVQDAEAAYYAKAGGYDFEDPGEKQAEELEGQQAEADEYDWEAGTAAELEAAATIVDAEMAWEEDEDPQLATRTKPAEVQAMISKRNQKTSYFPATAPKEPEKKAESGIKRIVGAVTGYNKLVPKGAKKLSKVAPRSLLETKQEPELDEDETSDVAPEVAVATRTAALPITPQEKLVQVRNLALKVGLVLDDIALKALARLPFYRARDVIDEVLLGGKNRRGVSNPSRYIASSVQRMSLGLGVEQGLAMELAVSVGVVLNNEALDELASIPRKESHAIIHELSNSEEARASPITYIRSQVARIRAAAEARPFRG